MSPDLPGGLAGLPEFLEQLLVAERVHRLPKAAVLEGIELIHGGYARQAVALPH